jgi:hypothetical protein
MSQASTSKAVDLDLVAQRIVKLAELSMLEHLEALMRSQADSLMALVQELETARDGLDPILGES